MRFHLLAIPHTVTHRDYCACAFTQKVIRLATMLKRLGHEVIHYGTEGSDVDCSEHVTVMTLAIQKMAHGDYNWKSEFFKADSNDPCAVTFATRATEEIMKRRQPRDFLLITGGWWHHRVWEWLNMPSIETGIGYPDPYAKYRVFDSQCWANFWYGKQDINDGRCFDAVIPNAFDPAEFQYCQKKDKYALFCARIVKRKGIEVAVEITRRLGIPLIVAGQGSLVSPTEGFDLRAPHVKHVGYADIETRKRLLANAAMLLSPTIYIEPFGMIAVEAAMSGTPVISSDWGAYPETVLHGVTGFRCRTMDHYIEAAKRIKEIDPATCRKWAEQNFSMERVAAMYQEYFEMVYQNEFSRGGTRNTNLNWLK